MADATGPGTRPGPEPRPDGTPPDRFRAFLVEKDGDAVRTAVRSLPLEALPDGEVLVRVDWSAVNYKDGMTLEPGNRVARISPLVPGVDLVGTVISAAGAGCAPGDQVIVHGHDLGTGRFGGFAELARVPGEWVVPLPAGLTARQAAAVGTAGFTAALSLRHLERCGLTPGNGPVLVTGASGGVGSMAVSLLSARGYEVVASTGKDSEHPYLTGLGAAAVVDRDEIRAEAGRTLGPERWAAAVDCVGGATLDAVLRTIRYGGAVAASGLTGGTRLETTVYPFIIRGVALLGVDSVLTPRPERVAVWEEIGSTFPKERIDATVASEIGLDGLADALATIGRGGVRGRILVRPHE